MTTEIKTLINQLNNDITTHKDVLDFLDVVDARTNNIVAQTILPQIYERLEKLVDNINKYIDILTNYDKNNDVDPNKYTFDVMYGNGKIEIGLQAPSKEILLNILKSCDSTQHIQILRVIDSNGKIIESNEPHWVAPVCESIEPGPIIKPIPTDIQKVGDIIGKIWSPEQKEKFLKNEESLKLFGDPNNLDDVQKIDRKKQKTKKSKNITKKSKKEKKS
jgi:hypothetical protein